MRPFRNIWLLEELGLPYKHVVCKPWSRVARGLHPMGKVPALLVESYCLDAKDDNEEKREDKFVVLESAAINTFLGDLARELSCNNTNELQNMPNSNKMLVPPPGTLLRAKYDSLTMFVMTEIDSQSLWIHRKHEALSSVFGEAPVAVTEAKRQFDNALDVMAGQVDEEGRYLLPTGFSAVDIIFANCCFWAQQIGWLARNSGTNNSDETDTSVVPKPLAPKLESYLKQCRSRPAFVKANELRKNQVDEKKEGASSKL